MAYQFNAKTFTLSSINVIDSGKKTSIQSADWHRWYWLHANGAAGILQGSTYLGGTISARLPFASGTISRTQYSFATVNSASLGARLGPLQLFASAFKSQANSGEAIGVAAHFGIVTASANTFFSRAAVNSTGDIMERLGRHLQLTEYVGDSAGRWSGSLGGGVVTNRWTANVGWETFYMPLLARPFERAATITLSFRLAHDSSVNVQTNINPNGRLQWGVYGGSYFYSSWEAEQQAGRNGPGWGKYIVAGVVEDSGEVVSGACVIVGNQTVFADDHGRFLARFNRPKQIILRLDTSCFELGDFVAVTPVQRLSPHLETQSVPVLLEVRRVSH
jgi:hypothetical protein